MNNPAPVVSARNVVKGFVLPDGRALEILRGVNLEVPPGASAAITGVSGSGKTTFLHILAGIERPDGGEIRVEGGRPGLVFQHHYLLPELNALENIALAARVSGLGKSDALAKSKTLLADVGLSERAAHLPAELSGGELARVAIARALSTSPRALLADEPTGNLDEETKERIQKLLFSVAADHHAGLIIVTHDLHLAAMADVRYHLEHGRLVVV